MFSRIPSAHVQGKWLLWLIALAVLCFAVSLYPELTEDAESRHPPREPGSAE